MVSVITNKATWEDQKIFDRTVKFSLKIYVAVQISAT